MVNKFTCNTKIPENTRELSDLYVLFVSHGCNYILAKMENQSNWIKS